MQKHNLKADFAWQRWRSSAADLEGIDPVLAARLLFVAHLINDFEQNVLQLKNEDCVWGPVHSSIGQEALAAAAIAALGREDKIIGSHRAHHQFLSKAVYHVAGQAWDPRSGDVPPAVAETVRRTLSEIMGLEAGYCGGRGGSMHLRYLEAGVLGTNGIVGGGIPIATGAAFAEKRRRTNNIVVCFFGDGAINQGSFHEACNLAGLWQLPIIYFLENNHYAVATPTEKATAVKDLSLRAQSYAMDGYIVEGNDVPAVLGVVRAAADKIRSGGPACIIEARCYRHYHHAGDQRGSAYGYRESKEEEQWSKKDALRTFPTALKKAGKINQEDVKRLQQMARDCVAEVVNSCTQAGTPRRVRQELWPNEQTAGSGLRSEGKELVQLDYREREDFAEFHEVTYLDAVAAVTGRWMREDPLVVELGEEVANFGGGVYGGTKGLPPKFPTQIINTPISEAGFVGLACGAAMSGMRPIVEIMFPDFALVAADQLFNQIGKARHMYGGTTDLPLVVRTRVAIGCGYGGQHSMDPIALFGLFPGWRIVVPADAFDYIGLFNTSMQSRDPVLIVEHHSQYQAKTAVPKDTLDYFIPFGRARIVNAGSDVTVLAYGAMTGRIVSMAERLSGEGISVELIDLRSVDFPSIDYATIGDSVKKTGAAVIVEEAPESQSIGSRIAAQIDRRFFDALDGPCCCVTSLDVPLSVSRALEAAALPSDQHIQDSIRAVGQRRWQ